MRNLLCSLFAFPSGTPTQSQLRRLAFETLESKLLLAPIISPGAQELLHNRVSFNQANFYVYQDGDSAFNHGFPSGEFPRPLIHKLRVNAFCVDDPNAATGCSPNPHCCTR